MAVDITNVIKLLQQKEHEVTSSTSTDDLIALFKASKKGAGAVIRTYDSDGALPDATTTNERIVFNAGIGELRFNNNGQWDYIIGGTAPLLDSWTFQGSNYGYTSGGFTPTDPTPLNQSIIQKFSFATDTNATYVGDLYQGNNEAIGASSSTHGYTLGGYKSPGPTLTNIIDKFPFATDENAALVGSLVEGNRGGAGSSSGEYGYKSGGYAYSPTYPSPAVRTNVIEKISYTSDGDGIDVGDLLAIVVGSSGQSSSTYGYHSGGSLPPNSNVIQKFPFASDTNSTDVGDLTRTTALSGGGHSSTEYGYDTYDTSTDKFSFASDGNATSVGTLSTVYLNGTSTQSSTTYGYMTGTGPTYTNIIRRFPFSVDEAATTVTAVTVGTNRYGCGQQY